VTLTGSSTPPALKTGSLLGAYLAYQQAHGMGRALGPYQLAGTGSLEDFLENVWAPSQRIGGVLSS
jgi:hypothetical protein